MAMTVLASAVIDVGGQPAAASLPTPAPTPTPTTAPTSPPTVLPSTFPSPNPSSAPVRAVMSTLSGPTEAPALAEMTPAPGLVGDDPEGSSYGDPSAATFWVLVVCCILGVVILVIVVQSWRRHLHPPAPVPRDGNRPRSLLVIPNPNYTAPGTARTGDLPPPGSAPLRPGLGGDGRSEMDDSAALPVADVLPSYAAATRDDSSASDSARSPHGTLRADATLAHGSDTGGTGGTGGTGVGVAAGADGLQALDAATGDGSTTVTLTRDDNGFGLTFGGAKTVAEGEDYGYGIFVAGTKEGSAASKEPALVVGLQIVTMNGVDLSDATFVELKETLRTTTGLDRVVLVLQPNDELYETYAERHKTRRSATTETVLSLSAGLPGGDPGGDAAAAAAAAATTTTVSVRLIPDDAGFGLMFGGAKTVAEGEKHGYGIFVSGTKEGSAAAKEPAIVVGLQIVTMNGVDLSNATFAELKQALRVTVEHDGGVTLVLRPNDLLHEAHTVPTSASTALSMPGDLTSSA